MGYILTSGTVKLLYVDCLELSREEGGKFWILGRVTPSTVRNEVIGSVM
jgi:hypothetical protein